MEPLLEIRDITKSFWGIKALDRVSFLVERGEVHALTGENGAGKSTLMKILAGLQPADSGEIVFRGSGLSMIHQELLPFPDLSVAENICMGQEPVRFGWVDRQAMYQHAERQLRQLGVSIPPSRRMGKLAVAEMQTVEIAKALVRRADLIIMDEPTSALSDHEAERLFSVIQALKQRGISIIYISHKLDEIFRLADRITVLRDGCHVDTRPASELNERQLIGLMVGRELASAAAPRHGSVGNVALEVRGLSRQGRFRNVSFELRRGEIVGIAGLMGAGRSDVAGAIFGLAPADSGHVLVNGRPVRIDSPKQALAHGIAMVTEDRKDSGIVPGMSVMHNLTLASLPRWSRSFIIQHRQEREVAAQQVAAFSIKTSGLGRPVKFLSGGNQQKLLLAKALLADPTVLILDEPTRGVDVGAKAEIYELIAKFARAGKAVLMISSEMNEILSLSDRILVMRQGVVSAELDPRQTNAEEILKHAMPN
jgi:ABC-type sugar transport system ATPase subunit